MSVDDIGRALSNAGFDLGFSNRFGYWSFRKCSCENLAAAGHEEWASRALLHKYSHGETIAVYKHDLTAKDLACVYSFNSYESRTYIESRKS